MRKFLFITMICAALGGYLHARQETSSSSSSSGSSSSSSQKCKEVKQCSDFKNAVPAETILIHTSFPLDLAIAGNGYFRVMLPDGTDAYTRYGKFRIKNNIIVTSDGIPLLGPFFIPPGSSNITISPDGQITVILAGVPTIIGQIQLAIFENPLGLKYIGNYLYLPTANSGVPLIGIPGQGGFGTLEQGYLEKSTVNDQSRIYTSTSNTVITDPGLPSAYPGDELMPSNDDGNLGAGHNVYANVAQCQLFRAATTNFIGAGFGGSTVFSVPVYNFGQILIRNRISGINCLDIKYTTVETFLGLTGYDGSYPSIGKLIILLWNVKTATWEEKYVNAAFPVQAIAAIDDPVKLQKITINLPNICKYIDRDGFINFFVYTPFSGTAANPQQPAQIDMGCFSLCMYRDKCKMKR